MAATWLRLWRLSGLRLRRLRLQRRLRLSLRQSGAGAAVGGVAGAVIGGAIAERRASPLSLLPPRRQRAAARSSAARSARSPAERSHPATADAVSPLLRRRGAAGTGSSGPLQFIRISTKPPYMARRKARCAWESGFVQGSEAHPLRRPGSLAADRRRQGRVGDQPCELGRVGGGRRHRHGQRGQRRQLRCRRPDHPADLRRADPPRAARGADPICDRRRGRAGPARL